jgi:hypothetical protein
VRVQSGSGTANCASRWLQCRIWERLICVPPDTGSQLGLVTESPSGGFGQEMLCPAPRRIRLILRTFRQVTQRLLTLEFLDQHRMRLPPPSGVCNRQGTATLGSQFPPSPAAPTRWSR